MSLTQKEKKIVEKLGECWNMFLSLPVEHGDDTDDFRKAIHDAQQKVLMRSGRREVNKK